ncbi:MAG: hypothetical protein WD552_01580 [Candidatus Paceibacterota bacterium]
MPQKESSSQEKIPNKDLDSLGDAISSSRKRVLEEREWRKKQDIEEIEDIKRKYKDKMGDPEDREKLQRAIKKALGKKENIPEEIKVTEDKLEGFDEESPESDKNQEDYLEKSLEEINQLDRKTISHLIEGGASDEQIISVAERLQEFTKFDGSSYYLSDQNKGKFDDSEKHKRQWRCRSVAGHRSEGDMQKNIFSEHIPRELAHYRDLLSAFGGTSRMITGINYLENSEGKQPNQIKEKLVKLAESGEYKDVKDTEVERINENEKISSGDLVYYMEKELRRWRDPKQIEAIKTVDGEEYAKFADDDSLYPLSKLEKAEEVQDSQYQPGPKDVAPASEDLESAPDAKELAQGVAVRFSEEFSISLDDLETVPGFTELSDGQQRLVLDNFRKLTLSRIEEEGIASYREDKDNSNWLSKIGKGFLSSYYKNKHITATGRELVSGGIDVHREALADVVKNTEESGLDLDENGELIFACVDEMEDLSDEEREIIERFNKEAQAFSHTSSQWEYKDGWSYFGGKNQEAYSDQLTRYEDAHRELVDLLTDKKGLEVGLNESADIDKKVRFTQFFASDGKYEKALQNIKKDDDSWSDVIKSIGKERGKYMAMGAVSRSSAVGVLGLVTPSFFALTAGGVLAGAGLGAYAGRKSGINTLEEDARLRRGGESGESELINVVPAEQLTQKLRSLIEQIQDPDLSTDDRDDAAAALKRRIRYTKQKVSGGNYAYTNKDGKKQIAKLRGDLVDYGDVSGRTGRKYQLIQTLSEAQSILTLSDPEVSAEINNRLDQYLDYKDTKIKEYVKNKTKRGALYGGTIGGVLGAIADFDFFSDTETPDTSEVSMGGESANDQVLGGADSTDTAEVKLGGEGGSADQSEAQLGGEDQGTTSGEGVLGGEDQSTTENESVPGGEDQSSTQKEAVPGGEDQGSVEKEAIPGSMEDQLGIKEAPTTQAADSTYVVGGESQPDLSEVPKPPLGMQEFIIDEDGEGMIHAIADGLKDEYNISHEKAMELGNKLFIKGEQLKGDDELFNLVGKGATFQLDFGDLSAEDISDLSTDELVEKIDFDNESDFDAGETGIKGLELPEQESTSTEYDPSVDQSGRFEDTTIQPREVEGVTFQDLREEAEMAQEQARQKAEAAKASNQIAGEGVRAESMEVGAAAEAESGLAAEPTAEAAGGEQSAVEQSAETEISSDATEVLREDVAERGTTSYLNERVDDLLTSIPEDVGGEYRGLSVNGLNELNDYMDTHPEQDMVTMVERMGQDNPRLLLTLDRLVNLNENPPGSLLDRLSGFIFNTIKEAEESGRLSQAIHEKIVVDKAHLDALASAEVTPRALDEMTSELKGLNSELNQYADKTNKGPSTRDSIKKFDDILKSFERVSNKSDIDAGSRFFGKARDLLDDILLDNLPR